MLASSATGVGCGVCDGAGIKGRALSEHIGRLLDQLFSQPPMGFIKKAVSSSFLLSAILIAAWDLWTDDAPFIAVALNALERGNGLTVIV